MQSLASRMRELIDQNLSNPEIVNILLNERYKIQLKEGDWNQLSLQDKREKMDKTVRSFKSKYLKNTITDLIITPSELKDNDITDLLKEKLRLDIEKHKRDKSTSETMVQIRGNSTKEQ